MISAQGNTTNVVVDLFTDHNWIKVLGDYADRVAAASTSSDASSEVFTTLHGIYESREWVEEWLEQSPEPKTHAHNWKADSKSRFGHYIRWKLDQEGRNGDAIQWRHTYQLLAAGEVVAASPTLRHGAKLTERSLRPLNWMVKNGYKDRLPEVVAEAVESAGSMDLVTYQHTSEAVQSWKSKWLQGRRGGRSRGAIDAAAKAKRLRLKMIGELESLYKLAVKNEKAIPEFEGFLDDIERFIADHQEKTDA